ncbi:hypothetical protein [Rhizobium sp. CNPSo 3490]|uniref:hypothetical protein n=1 Tax=Rhizobium sp. CNPSo 3490 TaxID=3021407 RepID=UPI00254DD658|nr:hypothetical protein [Rhizobium sp. CNPSo 3490]MDK4731560.1 hypothetical protein [Rhizobium sp. CNPSo 3490]
MRFYSDVNTMREPVVPPQDLLLLGNNRKPTRLYMIREFSMIANANMDARGHAGG